MKATNGLLVDDERRDHEGGLVRDHGHEVHVAGVERRRDGTDEGAGVAQEIVDRVLQVRSVVRIAGGHQGLGGLAAPLITKGKALGLLYFERTTVSGPPLDASDVHLMAMITNEAALVIAPLVVN